MLKKIVKWSAITLLSLILIIIIAMVIVVDFVFTPQRLTPVVVEAANKALDAKVEIDSVELTFFSSFPLLGVEIKNLTISSATDTIKTNACDTLLRVSNCYARINPLQLMRGRMVVNQFTLNAPSLYGYINTSGHANWDIVKQDNGTLDSIAEQDSITTPSTLPFDIDLQKLAIINGQITFDDRSTKLYTKLNHMNLDLQGSLLNSIAQIDMNFSANNILFWQNDELLVNKLRLGINTTLEINRDSSSIRLDKAVFDINGIRLGAGGTLQENKEEKYLDMNIHYGIDIPSLKTLLDMVPPTILSPKKEVKVNGSVLFEGDIQGRYGNGTFPLLTATLSLANGKVVYSEMPVSLEQLDVTASAFIDLNRKQESHIELSKFIFKGGSSHFNAHIKAEKLLSNPYLTAQLKGDVNLTDLTRIFPLQDSITCHGTLVANLSGHTYLKDIREGNYGKLMMEGSVGVEEIELIIPQEQISTRWKSAGISFNTNRTTSQVRQRQDLLNGIVGFSGLELIFKNRLTLLMDTTFVTFATTPLKDTSSIATMSSKIQLGKSTVIVRDTLLLGVHRVTAQAKLYPSTDNLRIPCIDVSGSIDSLRSQLLASKLGMEQTALNLTLCRDENNLKLWRTSGSIQLNKLSAFTPFFPLSINIPGTAITLLHNNIQLDSAVVKVGDSNLRLTGSVRNIANWMFNNQTVDAQFAVTSEMLNCNQLIGAMTIGEEYRRKVALGLNQSVSNRDSTEKAIETLTADSISFDSTSSIFIVPPKVDFTFQTDIKQAVFGKLYMDSIHGEVVMKNQAIELSNLKMRSSAANMETSMLYRASDSKEAYTGFSMNMYDIRIDSLVRLVPALDTLFPMLRSFEGVVNFQMAGETWLDSTMNIVLPTLRGAAYLDGHDLVLMDGETFSEISKMLMFKNKQKNSIDSISVSILIRNGSIEIFPFLIEIDRYKAAVGGKHNIDMSFNYHISLLKSPLPFRAGVNIYGTLDKMKFKITKAKYKDLFIPSRKNVIDSTRLNIEKEFKQRLNELTNPERHKQ